MVAKKPKIKNNQKGYGIASFPNLAGNIINRRRKSKLLKGKKKFSTNKYKHKRRKHTKPADVTGVFKPSGSGLQSKVQLPPTGIVRTDYPLTETAKKMLKPQMIAWTK